MRLKIEEGNKQTNESIRLPLDEWISRILHHKIGYAKVISIGKNISKKMIDYGANLLHLICWRPANADEQTRMFETKAEKGGRRGEERITMDNGIHLNLNGNLFSSTTDMFVYIKCCCILPTATETNDFKCTFCRFIYIIYCLSLL